MQTLKLSLVRNLRDALTMREIRNECASFMTKDTGEIGVFKQIWWWFFRKDKLHLRCFLGYYTFFPVAYGIIKEEKDYVLLSGGVLQYWRGKGFGRQMFCYLIDFARVNYIKDIRLEVLKTNTAAYNLYRSLGFKKTGTRNKGAVIKMKL